MLRKREPSYDLLPHVLSASLCRAPIATRPPRKLKIKNIVYEGTPHGNPSLLNYSKIISMRSPEFSCVSTYFFQNFQARVQRSSVVANARVSRLAEIG
jgi:hypothetical protein